MQLSGGERKLKMYSSIPCSAGLCNPRIRVRDGDYTGGTAERPPPAGGTGDPNYSVGRKAEGGRRDANNFHTGLADFHATADNVGIVRQSASLILNQPFDRCWGGRISFSREENCWPFKGVMVGVVV
jgi:hypothetical protein